MSRPGARAMKIPRPIIYMMVIGVVASWVPLAFIARARATKSEYPRYHIFHDMDIQPKYTAQDASNIDEGNTAMRLPSEGVVAQGALMENDHLYRGFETDASLKPVMVEKTVDGKSVKVKKYFTGFPMPVDETLLARGRERFDIFCAACHGHAGFGDGLVHRRALKLKQKHIVEIYKTKLATPPAENWANPVSFHDPKYVEGSYANGLLFDTITNGRFAEKDGKRIYTMRGYRSQIPANDRWAIVAYIRALQLSQSIKLDQMPKDLADQLPPEAVFAEAELLAKGQELFKTRLCVTCHQTDPNVEVPAGKAMRAPTFVGSFWGIEREVHVGKVGGPIKKVVFDEAYVKESLRDAGVLVAKNAITPMPAPLPVLTALEIKALTVYIKSFSKGAPRKDPVAGTTAGPVATPAGGPEAALIAKGKGLFQTKICFTCHQVDPKVPAAAGMALKAPKFIGKFWGTEREVHIGPGGPIKKVKMDAEYFSESIKKPMAKIVKGALPGMAPLPSTDEEIKALMAYIKSLSK